MTAQHCLRYITFSHDLNSWLAGAPTRWVLITAEVARHLVDAGYSVLDI